MPVDARRSKPRPASRRPPAPKPSAEPRPPWLALARQLRSWSASMLGTVGTATDAALMLAQARLQRPGPKAAVAKGAALLRELREAAGLSLEDLGRALEVDDPSFIGLVESGKIGLPFELILRLTAVLGRNDPIGFLLQMTRSYNPKTWQALEALGVGQLVVHAGRERAFANIYRGHDEARRLSDADFAAALAFADAAFGTAVAFRLGQTPKKRRPEAANAAGRRR